MLVKLENGVPNIWPVSEAHIQATYPNTSFVLPLDDETLDAFGYGRFAYSDPETYDAEFQETQELAPKLIKGEWVQQWKIVEKYTAEEKAVYIAKRDAALLEAQRVSVRADRDARLAASDWTQGKDISDAVSMKWAVYRQALRDVPQQTGFPENITWPDKPE